MTSAIRTALDKAAQLHASIVALPQEVRPTVDQIVRGYARLAGIRFEDLTGKSQAATISHHRHRLMYLIRKIDPVASYALIGRYLGGRDMATIHAAVAKVAAAIAESPKAAEEMGLVEDELRKLIARETLAVLASKPWQLLAATQVLRDDQLSDAEARKTALTFLSQLEANHA